MINPSAWCSATGNGHGRQSGWRMVLYSILVLARGLGQKCETLKRLCTAKLSGGEHAGIQHCLRLYTDSQHTRQKRFTHPVKRETVTCSSQGKPTLVFMDIFSFIDHRLSGSGFGCVHESVRVCLSAIPNKSFSTLNLTAISILILIVCLDVLEGFDV